ncbi:MAG: right-handed parallel beta-helix repeat-containing protein [Candidatus Acidiferrum sp.]
MVILRLMGNVGSEPTTRYGQPSMLRMIIAGLALISFPGAGATVPGIPSSLPALSGGLIITSANNGQTFQNLQISSKTGNCVTISGASNIILQNVAIGPCAGRGIDISTGNGIHIYDSYIHPEAQSPGCCDNDDGIFVHNGSKNIWIQGNIIAYGESNIEALGVASISVVGNFLLNPRGPFPRGQNFQCWKGCNGVTFSNNYTLSSTDTAKYLYPENQEDSVNFGVSDNITVQDNFITGGHSRAGCGLIADDRANNFQFAGNRLLNSGQCGIGIADGVNQLVTGNKVYNTNTISGGGNVGIYVWKQYKSACGPVMISNNTADEIRPDGTHYGYWKGGGCDPVTLTGNTFSAAADALLTPTATVFAPPPIPPQPKNCVATSPYSTNTSLPPCSETTTTH